MIVIRSQVNLSIKPAFTPHIGMYFESFGTKPHDGALGNHAITNFILWTLLQCHLRLAVRGFRLILCRTLFPLRWSPLFVLKISQVNGTVPYHYPY